MGVRASKLIRMIVGSRVNQRLLDPPPPPAIPKGYVPICVGLDGDIKEFIVHVKAFEDSDFLELLHKSAEEYGFRNHGILRIPYGANEFEDWLIRRAKQKIIRVEPI